MKRGAFIPLYVAVGLLAAVACRTAADPPPPPAPPAALAPPAAAEAMQPVDATPPPAEVAPVVESVPAAATPASVPETVSFEASVKPLLARTCTPCHVPGGKMYERMPFDRPEVILSHKEGVLRRMKNPDDHQLLERWFALQDKS